MGPSSAGNRTKQYLHLSSLKEGRGGRLKSQNQSFCKTKGRRGGGGGGGKSRPVQKLVFGECCCQGYEIFDTKDDRSLMHTTKQARVLAIK